MENSPMSSQQENNESKERKEFSIEEIQNLLKQIDGKERPKLSILEKKEDRNGELIYMIFSGEEKETKDGQEYDITYNVEFAGQRYNTDGTLGRIKGKTEISKDYDNGIFSIALGDYIEGEWKNLQKLNDEAQ
jgi:hypothetical protein